MESHASVARQEAVTRTLAALRGATRRLYTSLDPAITFALAAGLAATAFVANGGLQLGRATLVEAAVLAVAAVVVAAALVFVGFEARLHGGVTLTLFALLGVFTGLSIVWSLHPSGSWLETNRTLAYVAAFGAGIAAVRLARGRWPAVLWGVLLALAAVSVYGLATKVAPAWLAPDETFARLREPYGYWNAVGVTAAMGIPLCLWLGARRPGHPVTHAFAYPLLGLFAVTVLLSFSRGSILAAVVGIAVWLALVPLRLRSLAVLLPSVMAAALVTAWAFSQSALTDDRVPLVERKDAGVELGLILAAMVILLLAGGLAIALLAERRPPTERTRRKLGITALAALAATPLLALGALSFSERGVTGTISDRWHDLTSQRAPPPGNDPNRLTQTASVRAIYWKRAINVWDEHAAAGSGAGGFAQAQLRFRKNQAKAKHAHGYVFQTLADLGLVGLGLSVLALGAWLLAARSTLALRRPGFTRDWTSERTGLAALALVAVVFGVHSAVDWTWFVPAVALTASFSAGWVAGRGPLAARETAGHAPPLEAARLSLPRGAALYRRLGVALATLAVGALAALAVVRPWRAHEKGAQALSLAEGGHYAEARAAAQRAHDLNSLSAGPYLELSVVEDASGHKGAALAALQRAVVVEPANPEAWRRLGEYYLGTLGNPQQALRVLRGALFLDPLSRVGRNDFLAALRANEIQQGQSGPGRPIRRNRSPRSGPMAPKARPKRRP